MHSYVSFLYALKRRLASVKQAADAAGRKICFIGMSLTTYLEAAHREGRAPFDPAELVAQEDMNSVDPNKLLVVTTGSQVDLTEHYTADMTIRLQYAPRCHPRPSRIQSTPG